MENRHVIVQDEEDVPLEPFSNLDISVSQDEEDGLIEMR